MCNVCRPAGGDPLANVVTSILAAFNAKNPNYTKPNLYNDAVWYGDFDGRVTLPGDYLVRQSDGAIWFIAAQEQLLPIVLVSCNRSLQILREPLSSAVGVQPYGGLTALTDVLPAAPAMWPCSILIGGRVQMGEGLPTDVKQGGWKILLPPTLPIVVDAGDILVDDLSRKYAVETAEQSDLGWRIIANEQHE